MHDLLVVGAGPVGSRLAKNFADRGADVVVIEQSDEVGRPLACSGHVSPDIWSFVDDRDRLYQNEIKGACFHSGDNEYKFFRDEPVSYVIDRVELDKLKAEEASNAGAEYRLGEKVTGVEEKEEWVTVKTDKGEYEASVVAGCDGANSTVRDTLGLPEPDHFYQGMLCFSDEDDSGDFVDVFLDVPEFFGWRIPRGDSVEYGVAVPQGESPMKWLNHVTDNFIDRDQRENICAGAIPIGPPSSVTSDRVFLVGDAAGQTKPFTGGGILYGMRSADVAAETIDLESPEMERYEKAWRKELMTDIRLGKVIESSYSWPSPVQRLGMKIFSGRIGVHMDRPTSLFSLEQLKSMLHSKS